MIEYQVVISDDAKAMLAEHAAFLANVSISAANKLIDTIEGAFISLSRFPYRCATYELRRVKGSYRRMVVGHYAIIYSVDETSKTVKVYYILDSRQNVDM